MHEDLMERVVTSENATAAWKAVKRNQGAPGIDGMTTEQLRDHIRQHWEAARLGPEWRPVKGGAQFPRGVAHRG